jgi:hypothetical protein
MRLNGYLRNCAVIATASLLTISRLSAQTSAIPGTVIVDGRALAIAKQRMQQGDPATSAAVQTLVGYADKQLQQGPYTVTEKSKVPPSGDKRDYMSQGRYFWPDPTKPNGLPYLRKDGETNPDSRGGDEDQITGMSGAVEDLSLAYFFTGTERYATHAAILLRTWFIDPQRRMNPRMLYGQSWPGRSEGRSEAILETRHLMKVVDALGLLETSHSLTAADRSGIQAWFREYAQWLDTSQFGREEASGPNNHGTWCNAQLACFSVYVGDLATARRVLEAAKATRCTNAIEPDGRQPFELARVDAFGYSVFNLEALTNLAAVGRVVGVDLWNYQAMDGRGIRAAGDWLRPYAAGEQRWSFGKKPPVGHNDTLIPLYRKLANAYDDPRYEALIAGLPEYPTDKHRVTLALHHPRIPPIQLAQLGGAANSRPKPPTAALTDVMAGIESKYAAELQSAKTSAQCETLIRKLATESQGTKVDPVVRYAMLTTAQHVATSPLNAPMLRGVVALMARDFDVDDLQEYLNELVKAQQATHNASSEAATSVIAAALSAADEAASHNRFDMAGKFLTLASQAAATIKDSTVAKTVTARRSDLQQVSREFTAYQRAQGTLAQRADDAAACLAMGRYLCFVNRDWSAGVPYLTRCNQPALKSLALECAAPVTDTADLRRRGDAWWQRAQSAARGTLRRDLERGARHWYTLAIEGLTGSDLATTLARLEQLGGPESGGPLDLIGSNVAPPAVAANIASSSTPSTSSAAPAMPKKAPATPGEANRMAAEEVLRLGGFVTVSVESQPAIVVRSNDELPAKPFVVQRIDLTKALTVTDDTLQCFAPLNELRSLVLDGTSVGDAGLVHLRGLDNLVELFLDDTKRITDVGLPHLKGLIKLQELRLKRQRITDAGLVHLESLLALDKLRLGYDEGVTDAGLQSLAKIPALTYVNAEGTSITAAAVAKLKAVRPNLRIRIGK